MKVYRIDLIKLTMSPVDIAPVADPSSLDGTDHKYRTNELEALETLEPLLAEKIKALGETETQLNNHHEIIRDRINTINANADPAPEQTEKPSKPESKKNSNKSK